LSHGITGIAQSLEVNTFDYPTIRNVQTGNDSPR
jgi:hypothetical protein